MVQTLRKHCKNFMMHFFWDTLHTPYIKILDTSIHQASTFQTPIQYVPTCINILDTDKTCSNIPDIFTPYIWIIDIKTKYNNILHTKTQYIKIPDTMHQDFKPVYTTYTIHQDSRHHTSRFQTPRHQTLRLQTLDIETEVSKYLQLMHSCVT